MIRVLVWSNLLVKPPLRQKAPHPSSTVRPKVATDAWTGEKAVPLLLKLCK